jgi:hypothetical protein
VDRVSSGLRDYTRCGMYMRRPSAIWLLKGCLEGAFHHVACATKNVASSAGSGAFLILFAVPCELSVLYHCTTEASRLKKRKQGRGVLLHNRQSLTCTEYSSAE